MTRYVARKSDFLKGRVRVPGDKSISHRAALIGSIADGEVEITNFLEAEDCLGSLGLVQALGIKVEKIESKKGSFLVHGAGLKGYRSPSDAVDVGNSGTTMRLGTGLISGQPVRVTLTGDESLRRRPMRRVIEPLAMMGITVESNAEKAPLTIQGGTVRPIAYQSPVASAQVKSCVLLAGLYASGITSVAEPSLSRDHTERMLEYLDVPLHKDKENFSVRLKGPVTPRAKKIEVPGDISSAAFPLCAAAAIPRSEVIVENVGINPTRTGILDVLKSMGARLGITNERMLGGEPAADITITASSLKGTIISGDLIPRLIDEIPVLAFLAARAEGRTIVKDARELRVKETDRIAGIAEEFAALGVQVETFEDGLSITGPQEFKGGEVDSRGDHRLAMTLALAGLTASGPVTVRNTACVNTSFPNFVEDMQALGALTLERVE